MPNSQLCPPSDVVVALLVKHGSVKTGGDWFPLLSSFPRVTPHHPPVAKLRQAPAPPRVPPALVGKGKGKKNHGRGTAVAFPATQNVVEM